jgi:hypothetical protein
VENAELKRLLGDEFDELVEAAVVGFDVREAGVEVVTVGVTEVEWSTCLR